MSHTIRHRTKLARRVARIRGQLEAVARAVDGEAECGEVLRLIASARGAMNPGASVLSPFHGPPGSRHSVLQAPVAVTASVLSVRWRSTSSLKGMVHERPRTPSLSQTAKNAGRSSARRGKVAAAAVWVEISLLINLSS